MYGPVSEAARALVDLGKLHSTAAAIQWEAPDGGSGGDDPTASVALDTRRLRVRDAVTLAEETLRYVTEACITAGSHLADALDEWDK